MQSCNRIKIARFVLGILYALVILRVTLIGRSVHSEHLFYGLFWELRGRMWKDIALNIILFIPLGFIIGGWRGIAVGFFLSCGIESVQYFTRLGYCELDDVLNNTIGAFMGGYLNIRVGAAMLKRWEELPEFMRVPEVRPYYDILYKKRFKSS